MELQDRTSLTKSLSKISVEIAAGIRPHLLEPGPYRERGEALWREEHVGAAYTLWTDLLSRRAAVLWVLRSLYLRILEDRGLTKPKRIVDAEGEELFAHLAPNLGPTAYLRWAFEDLASQHGGLPELFAAQPAEIVPVPDVLTRKLLDLWRGRDPDTGVLRYRFDHERFDSRLMGDLYQDLDPVVRKRFALLQTPDFVLDFILDETLTPAIAEWGIDVVRVLDPACGSGHFLLAALQRLVGGMRKAAPGRPVIEVVKHALARVVGIDLNDYACALARARLVMTALEICREDDPMLDLTSANDFHPRVYCADALEQVEDEQQLDLAGIPSNQRDLRSQMTPPEVRAALAPELRAKFHVVVGNPPYVTEKDPDRREYHRKKIGKRQRYVSAARSYSLGAPFTERMLALACEGGFVGEITADSFMKREFGKMLIEHVLARRDLRKVVSTSGAFIPGHGTPTVILFARNRSPDGDLVRVVMGKRGEPGRPKDAAKGKVWSSILALHETVGGESEFISVADVPRATLSRHQWSIGGGGAAELKNDIERSVVVLGSLVDSIGRSTVVGEDDAWLAPSGTWERMASIGQQVLPLLRGEDVRDWVGLPASDAIYPYSSVGGDPVADSHPLLQHLWKWRRLLEARTVFGKEIKGSGRLWWEHLEHYASKLKTPLSIAFAFKATHNHFVLDRGGKVFKQTAPVIKLPHGATEAEHLVLLAQLNSSVGCFWLKQVCQTVGEGGGTRVESGNAVMGAEGWRNTYEHDGSKLEGFPVLSGDGSSLVSFATALDRLARERLADSPDAAVAGFSKGARELRSELDARRQRDLDRLFQMVALQEELDWLCIKLYGVDPDVEVRAAADVPAMQPGHRPFELSLALENAERHEVIARGEEPDEQPTEWFKRHGWKSETSIDAIPETHRAIVADRIERTEASRELGLLEQPTYKRRWHRPDHDKEEREAFVRFLDDRIEAWAKDRKEPFTVAQVAAALRSDPAVLAVGELYTRRSDFDVDALLDERVRAESVPNNKHHVFKPEGLLKRAGWEDTWRLQHEEDAGAKVTPPVPEKYDSKDYLKASYWGHRGKLDVPKERFIAFTEVPSIVAEQPLYGWAGWTPRERARALLALDEKLEGAGVSVAERYGVLHGVWFLLPYVAWESLQAAADLRADVKSLVGANGVTDEMLAEWAGAFAATAFAAKKKPAKAPKPPKEPKPPKPPKEPKAPKRAKKEKGGT